MKEQEHALHKFAAVSYINQLLDEKYTLAQALRMASMKVWGERAVSTRTLERWYYRYRHYGYGGLCTKSREDKGRRKALDVELKEAIVTLRKKYPQLTVKNLIAQLHKSQVLSPQQVSASSIYRFLREEGLDKKGLNGGALQGPTKAFEFSSANELWMTDLMYGINLKTDSGKVIRTRLIAIIDDCSRLIVHAQYYEKETLDCFLDTLKKAVAQRGLPLQLYTDRGKIFTNHHVRQVCANLGIKLIHAKPYHAWSKGKIERYFLTLQKNFEAPLILKPVKSLAELNSRLWQWIEQTYHQNKHSALQGQSPAERFMARSKNIQTFQGSERELDKLFYKRIQRRVRKDGTVSVDSCLWEVPSHLRGCKVQLRYNPFVDSPVIDVYFKEHFVGVATRCDKVFNAHHFTSSNYEHR